MSNSSFGIAVSKQLIRMVEQYPELYDTRSDGYKHADTKQSRWETIAQHFGLPGGDSARGKWKNLRDAYVKYLKQVDPYTNESTSKKFERWPYVGVMDFLKPIILERRTNTNHTHTESVEEPHQVDVKLESNQDDSRATFESTELALYDEEDPLPTKKQALDYTTSYKQLDDLDATDLLFLSYAKTLKTLSPRVQINTKLKISQVVFEAELQSLGGETSLQGSTQEHAS